MVTIGTTEEFYTRCRTQAKALEAAARAFAAHGEAVDAVACAWGADIAVVQAELWERIVLGSRTPLQRYYQAGDAVTHALVQTPSTHPALPDTSAEHLVADARQRFLRAFDARLAHDLDAQLPSLAYLSAVAAPNEALVTGAVSRRLLGMRPGAFVERRRADAAAAMVDARTHLDDGDLEGAIRWAYDSDSWTLSAYLVESAMAVGDESLFTVTTRWEVVNAAVEAIASLPADFSAAITVLRTTVHQALGDSDGTRLRDTLVPT